MHHQPAHSKRPAPTTPLPFFSRGTSPAELNVMKQNSFKPRQIWNLLTVLAALNLVPYTTGLHSAPSAQPQDKAPDKPEKNELEQKYQGKVEALSAETFRVDGKVYNVTRDTKISRDTIPVKLSDIVVGDSVSGLARMGFNGKLEAMTVVAVAQKKN
jgi:hypothetical protein